MWESLYDVGEVGVPAATMGDDSVRRRVSSAKDL